MDINNYSYTNMNGKTSDIANFENDYIEVSVRKVRNYFCETFYSFSAYSYVTDDWYSYNFDSEENAMELYELFTENFKNGEVNEDLLDAYGDAV